jgi:DNA-binding transcriptional MerR regulator
VLLIRRIRELLYEQGFTISGARNRLDGRGQHEVEALPEPLPEPAVPTIEPEVLRAELHAILALLKQGSAAA